MLGIYCMQTIYNAAIHYLSSSFGYILGLHSMLQSYCCVISGYIITTKSYVC